MYDVRLPSNADCTSAQQNVRILVVFWGLSALKKCQYGPHLSAFKWQFGPLWE